MPARVTFSENDQLYLVCIRASVMPALSLTAIWSLCSSHSHLWHVITFSWVIFRISEQWTTNLCGCERRGRGRGSQRVSLLPYRKVMDMQIRAHILFNMSWGRDSSLEELHSQQKSYMLLWPPISRYMTYDKDMLDRNLSINLKYIFCMKKSALWFFKSCLSHLSVYGYLCFLLLFYVEDLNLDIVVYCAVKTTLSTNYINVVHTHTYTMAFWVPGDTSSQKWFSFHSLSIQSSQLHCTTVVVYLPCALLVVLLRITYTHSMHTQTLHYKLTNLWN